MLTSSGHSHTLVSATPSLYSRKPPEGTATRYKWFAPRPTKTGRAWRETSRRTVHALALRCALIADIERAEPHPCFSHTKPRPPEGRATRYKRFARRRWARSTLPEGRGTPPRWAEPHHPLVVARARVRTNRSSSRTSGQRHTSIERLRKGGEHLRSGHSHTTPLCLLARERGRGRRYSESELVGDRSLRAFFFGDGETYVTCTPGRPSVD